MTASSLSGAFSLIIAGLPQQQPGRHGTEHLQMYFDSPEWVVPEKWLIYQIPERIPIKPIVKQQQKNGFRFPKNGQCIGFPTYRSPTKQNASVLGI